MPFCNGSFEVLMTTARESVEGAKGRKRVFFGLAGLGVVLLAGLVALMIFLLDPRLSQISPLLSIAVAVVGFFGLGYLLAGLALAAVTAARKQPIRARSKPSTWAVHLLLPVAVWLGKLVGMSRKRVQRSFVEVNNVLAESRVRTFAASTSSVLVLVPHCLQCSECAIRVTADFSRCRACGRCDLGVLREMADRDPELHVAVATGGEAARQIVKKLRPRLIIAVACERDLTHGICDVGQIPVLGIINRRPNGPCKDTRVDTDRILEAVQEMRRTSETSSC
jgi:hypothetical protein